MAKIQFTLEAWLKDKSQNVETRDGRTARIICTDAKADDGACIIALIPGYGGEEAYQFFPDGRAFSSKSSIEDCADLFIVTPEPELSEDERIRKEIVVYFNNRVATAEETELLYFKRWIAYLERQEEYIEDIRQYAYNKGLVDAEEKQKPLSTEETELNSIAFLEQLGYTCVPPGAERRNAELGEDEKNWRAVLEYIKDDALRSWLEKQKEQKPSTPEDIAAAYQMGLAEGRKEQKPAEWSEEDKKMLDNTLDSLRRYQLSMPNFQVELQMRWLKSLRPKPKQKSHLGMKDQWCYNAACAAVRDSDAYSGEVKQFILDFLQRCETLPHWKPSKEQMDALDNIASAFSPKNKEYKTVMKYVNPLREDLKKL